MKNASKIRFIHSSDWQLGMARAFLPEEAASRFSQDRIDSIRRLGELASELVHNILTASAARDAELAREVIATDDKVDAFYNSIFRNLVSHMVENPATISSAAQLLFVARNLERIGDHATNVAEMVHFAATGTYPPDEER